MSSPNADLLNFLSGLPNLDTTAERKALISFTGYAFIGMYLDYSGSQIAFAQEIIDEVSRRGQPFSVQFLDGLKLAPQVGPVRQDELSGLQNQLKSLSSTDWQNAFPTPAPTAADRAMLIADPDMLAMTVVSGVLLPYYTLGSDKMGVQTSANGVAVAQQLEEILAANPQAGAFLTMFKPAPTATEAAFLGALKGIVAQDGDLARSLVQILTSEQTQETALMQSMVDVSQNIREVSGDVVGAIVGQEVVGRLTVKQDIDTVASGGTVVGAVIGGSGAMRIGGQTIEGDNVAGDKIEGDQVDGDQIHLGDISNSSGIAIGRDSSATVVGDGGVNVGGSVGGAIVTGDRNTLVERPMSTALAIRLDVATPSGVSDGEVFEMAVAVRTATAPPLVEAGLDQVISALGSLPVKPDKATVKGQLVLRGIGCTLDTEKAQINLQQGTGSQLYYFIVTPNRVGTCRIIVNLQQEDGSSVIQLRAQVGVV